MEDKLIIFGGRSLKGEVNISGSKNSSLPILAATLLTPERCVVSGLPDLTDVSNLMIMLSELGVHINVQENQVCIQAKEIQQSDQNCYHAKKLRASFLLMGPLLARKGEACLALPGGCAIGSRPVDLHLKGFAALGAAITIEKGFVKAEARRLVGSEIYLDFPSVGATENIMMAAACAQGTTVLINAAAEPEIVDLAEFLNKMGAKITGAGTSVIRIKGSEYLHGAVHTVIPDRIEAGTYCVAAAATKGQVHLLRVVPGHIRAVISVLRRAGVDVEEGESDIFVDASRQLKPVKIKTSPYPGFPTDMQPQFAALLTTVPGTSMITETVFDNRFLYAYELIKMGAAIEIKGKTAVVRGVSKLLPATVDVTDLRAGAALVIAALKTWGETQINYACHLDRGYENLEGKLAGLGAKIHRVAEKAANL